MRIKCLCLWAMGLLVMTHSAQAAQISNTLTTYKKALDTLTTALNPAPPAVTEESSEELSVQEGGGGAPEFGTGVGTGNTEKIIEAAFNEAVKDFGPNDWRKAAKLLASNQEMMSNPQVLAKVKLLFLKKFGKSYDQAQ